MGERTLGAYRIESEIGSGGMGRVYLAEVIGRAPGLSVGSRVAIKIVHPHLLESPGFFKRFLREARIGRAVRHANVVRTHDVDALSQEGVSSHFLVMEYVEGQTLRGLLNELEQVPEELCRHVGREVARGLAAIHEAGVIHRDLKPGNVLITPAHIVKIMDLGVAKLADEAIRLSQTGAFLGSVHYAAPEQFRGGGENVDGRADLHALGLILYELASGEHPYVADGVSEVLQKVLHKEPRRLSELNPQVSPFFEEVVHRLLEKDREKRFPSALEVLRVLEEGERSAWWRSRAVAIRAETNRPLRRIRIPRETEVWGREAELLQLARLYRKAAGGEGQVVLVEGEAGIGKTRLVDEMVGRLRSDGEDLNFLYGSYPPGGAATAAGAWSTAYREHFGSEDLEQTLSRYLTVTPVLIPSFAALLRGEPPPTGGMPLDRDSIHTVFVRASRALARERPTVILIEDQHFAPEEGRALLAALALAVADDRILLIGTSRPSPHADWIANLERLEHASRIQLSRLGAKDLARLLKDAFRSERLARELGLKIAEKSDGNPFFVFEIIRGLRESRLIRKRPDGRWVSTQKIREIEIPSSVLDLIQARIAGLAEEEQELLDLASCCGFSFDPTLVADVLGAERIPVLRRLGHLERTHRLVRAVGRRFAFDHHQVQETLYRGLSELLREQYHAALGNALQVRETAGVPAGAAAVDLAEHFLKGDRADRALLYLDAAVDHLEEGYLNDHAIGLIDRALASGVGLSGVRRAGMLVRKAAFLDLLGRREAQGASLTEALSLAGEDNVLRIQALKEMGRYFLNISRPEEGHAELLKALELARSSEAAEEEAEITGILGITFWSRGKYEEALERFRNHLEIARRSGDRRGEARATGNTGLVFSDLGRLEEAREQCEQCIELAREIGDRRIEGTATMNLGRAFWQLGRYEEARDRDLRCIEVSREIGDRRNEAIATGNLGLVYWSLGDYEQARIHHERHLAISLEIGDRRNEAMAVENLGLVCSSLGRRDEARRHYERQLAITKEIRDRQSEGRANGNLGGLFRALGYAEKGLGHYLNHNEIAREIGDRRGEAVSLRNLGSIMNLLGDPDAAEEWLKEGLSISREVGARDFEALALASLGGAALLRGDTVAAERWTEESLELYRKIGQKSGISGSLVALGNLQARAGRESEALEAYREARKIAEDLKHPGSTAQAAAWEATITGDAAHALEAFAEREERLSCEGKLEIRFLLWKATDDPAHLAEALRLLDHLVTYAPARYRESMVDRVPMHRELEDAR